MEKMIPREKMSKSQRRKLDLQKRAGWGGLNPITRRMPNGKAYNRKKIQKGVDDVFRRFESFSFCLISAGPLPILSPESRPARFLHPSESAA
ncbi:MAG: hypothetical protein E7512_10345 [[Clostridium] sporosphaeroides]|uniref:Uncharacterized protein n=1 Tax=Faecalispora sporosphaeroides TaxID=1549 RepID=A0A928Q5K6_9FIRM|nr:hypothetical protein [Faecalispora sporosphaeroides]